MLSIVIISALSITTVFGDGDIVNCAKEEDCECNEDASECTINCIGDDQCKDLEMSCNEVDLCTINCIGDNACAGNTDIDGSEASTVRLLCYGKDACKGNVELYCGEGDCSIACVNSTSCESIDIDAEDASSFECDGYCDVSDDIPDSFAPSTTTTSTTEDPSAESTETFNTTESTSTTSTTTLEPDSLESTDMESTEWTTTTSTSQRAEFIADDSSETTMTQSITPDLSTTDIEDLISSTEEDLTSTTYSPTESMEESSNSTTTTSTTTSTANVQILGQMGVQSNGEQTLDQSGAFANNEDHYHDLGGHETHVPMFLIIVAGAVLLIACFVFAMYCRLRMSTPKTHERVQSGIALDDMDLEVDDENDGMETDMGIDLDVDTENDNEYGYEYDHGMVHTGYGCVEPGTFTSGRTDGMYMLPH